MSVDAEKWQMKVLEGKYKTAYLTAANEKCVHQQWLYLLKKHFFHHLHMLQKNTIQAQETLYVTLHVST